MYRRIFAIVVQVIGWRRTCVRCCAEWDAAPYHCRIGKRAFGHCQLGLSGTGEVLASPRTVKFEWWTPDKCKQFMDDSKAKLLQVCLRTAACVLKVA
jgi:hypothetical protein